MVPTNIRQLRLSPNGAMWRRIGRLASARRCFSARARGVVVKWDEHRGFGKARFLTETSEVVFWILNG